MCSIIGSMSVRAANVGVNLVVTQSVDVSAQIGARQHLAHAPQSVEMFFSSATRLVQLLN